MPSINFYLEKTNRKGEAPIMLTFQDKGKRFRYYTKQKVLPRYWKGQRVIRQHSEGLQINSILENLESTINSILREGVFSKSKYSFDDIKAKFMAAVGNNSSSEDFFSYYESFINYSKATKARRTIQAYSSTKSRLQQFEAKRKRPIVFSEIDASLYTQFVTFLIEDCNLLNNSVGKHVKTLKTFLNFATDREWTKERLNVKKFKVFNEDVDIVYLTEEELLSLCSMELSSSALEKVRDCFCFCCFTGLRFSDIEKLKKYNIRNKFIEFRSEKTKSLIRVPLNHYAESILNKYSDLSSDLALPTVTNQKSNNYLKQICQAAGLNDVVETEKFSGSKKLIIRKFKWQLISTHTARRTFVTLALEKGIRAEVVMSMTGHRSYRTFQKYIKITENVMQAEMNRVWPNTQLKAV